MSSFSQKMTGLLIYMTDIFNDLKENTWALYGIIFFLLLIDILVTAYGISIHDNTLWQIVVILVASVLFIAGFTLFFITCVSLDNWRGLICESDWYPSISRAQFLTWNIMIGIVFVLFLFFKIVYALQNFNEINISSLMIPNNLLLLMGATSFTTLAGKGLSASKYQGTKDKPAQHIPLKTMFFENDKPSPARYQIFLWTSIGVITYMVLVLGAIYKNYSNMLDVTLPDCPEILLVLMGVSQATYLAGKALSQKNESGISRIIPHRGKLGEKVTIHGFNFGGTNTPGSIRFLNKEMNNKGKDNATTVNFYESEWEDNCIKLTLNKDIIKDGLYEVRVLTASGNTTFPYEYRIG